MEDIQNCFSALHISILYETLCTFDEPPGLQPKFDIWWPERPPPPPPVSNLENGHASQPHHF